MNPKQILELIVASDGPGRFIAEGVVIGDRPEDNVMIQCAGLTIAGVANTVIEAAGREIAMAEAEGATRH